MPVPEQQSQVEVLDPIPVVMARLSAGRTSIYRLIAAGELQAVTVGLRSRRIVRSSVDDFIERRKVAS